MTQSDPRRHKQKWKRTAKLTRSLTRDRCCNCGAAAKEVHHSYYGIRVLFLTLPLSGFEIPGWQIFPLCDKCHSNSKHCAHHISNYQASKLSDWFNCNTSSYLWGLRFKFLLTVAIVHPLTTLLILIGLWLSVPTIFAGSSWGRFLSPASPRSPKAPNLPARLLHRLTPPNL